MSDRNYLDEAMPCPVCGNPNCALEVQLNQERENTCPSCGTTFVDAHEQFGPQVYVGLYYEGAEETDPPVAMFRDRALLDLCVELMKHSADEDARHVAEFAVPMDTTIYGAYWNSSGDNPYGEKPIPFTPESLPRQPSEGGSLEVTSGNMTPLPIKMHKEFTIGPWNVYFCRNNQRWYMFVLFVGHGVEFVSINNGPAEFIRAHMAGMKNAMLMAAEKTGKKGLVTPITWDEFVAADGKINVETTP